MIAIGSALDAWRSVLGADRVIAGGEALSAAHQATYALPQRAAAILEPETREEVQACLRVAREYGVPLYPVSGGKNWGYGSRLPTTDGAVLLSLARMNRILDYREDLAYVTVEPGVTFRMLAEFLQRQGSALLPPAVGTRADASLIGNVMERGLGKGLYEELSARSCGYEAILPNGQVVRTGFAGLPGALAGPLRADGFGPSLQGLLCQSNLAVVTQMTLWLAPIPAWRQRVWFTLSASEQLAGLVEAVRPLLLRSGERMQVEMVNDYRVAASNGQYPFELYPDGRVLPREAMQWPRWVGGIICWADDAEELQWRRRLALGALGTAGVTLAGEDRAPGYDPADVQDGMFTTYWRKRYPAPEERDPDRDRCGVIWHPPVLPMQGALVAQTADLIDQIMLGEGFEPFTSLRMVGGRSIHAIVGLTYDREAPGADARAARCHQALREALRERGLYPYRLGLIDMADQPAFTDDSRELLRAIKQMVDPGGILAPGRYIRP